MILTVAKKTEAIRQRRYTATKAEKNRPSAILMIQLQTDAKFMLITCLLSILGTYVSIGHAMP